MAYGLDLIGRQTLYVDVHRDGVAGGHREEPEHGERYQHQKQRASTRLARERGSDSLQHSKKPGKRPMRRGVGAHPGALFHERYCSSVGIYQLSTKLKNLKG